MKKKSFYFWYPAIVLMFVGCMSKHVERDTNEHYEPTTHIDVYDPIAPTNIPFKRIGTITLNSSDFWSRETLINKFVEIAKEEGADAIMTIRTNTYTTYSRSSYGSASHEHLDGTAEMIKYLP